MSEENQTVQAETVQKTNQTIINYLNNVIKFDKDFKFEEYNDKKCKNEEGKEKNISIIEFNKFSIIGDIEKKFNEIDKNVKPDFKLTQIIPNILNYKLRGILDISQQFTFDDSNIDQFIEYETKTKPIPTLEEYVNSIKSYVLSDKMKIKIFNCVFPHGIHQKSINKTEEEIKGVDKIYVQKIGVLFDKVLDLICKGKDEKTIMESIKVLVADKYKKTLSTLSARKQFDSTISSINIEEIMNITGITDPNQEQKEQQKKLIKDIRGYKEEVQKWISDVIIEIQYAKRLNIVITEGLTQNELERKSLLNYYKTYVDYLQRIQSLANQKVLNNNDFIQFSRLVINTGNSIFGDKKGLPILIDAKANIKSLLSHKDSKAFDEGSDLPEETIKNLFEAKKESSRIKSLTKIIDSKTIPQNTKIALGIYITNEFYETIEKEIYNKQWSRRTFYIKF